jgi:uncharacterized protein with HEPN domain
MSRHDPMVSMHQMFDHAREAVQFARGRKREDLETDRLFYLAMVQLVQIIGEAARRVPRDCRSRWSGIPWPEVTGMRDRLIHGYDVVDLDFLWTTVTKNLPPLIVELEKIVPPPKSG